MKKRLISLVAAAALVGGISIAQAPAAKAGTVTVAGDTQVQLYGGVQLNTNVTKKMESLGNVAVDETDPTKPDYYTYHKTNFHGFSLDGAGTKLGVKLANKDANLTGKLEFGMNNGGFHFRKAYIEHHFDNGLFLLIGQDNIPYEQHTFSINPDATAGFDRISRAPQITVGGSLDIADSASFDFRLGLVQNGKESDTGSAIKNIRYNFPAIALDAGINFQTGFGSPARVYGGVYIDSNKYAYEASSLTEKTKTNVAYNVGFVLPVSMVTLQSEYQYGKGMNGLAGVVGGTVVPSVYVKNSGAATASIKQTKFYAYNIEAKIAPMPCVAFAVGYDYLKFKNISDYSGITNGAIKKNDSYFVNTSIKTTKYTTLNIEWQHNKTKYTDGTNTSKIKGDLFVATYAYTF